MDVVVCDVEGGELTDFPGSPVSPFDPLRPSTPWRGERDSGQMKNTLDMLDKHVMMALWQQGRC